MAEWKRVKIGDVCTIEKGVTGIAKALPGDYPLVTTGAERKTSRDYQFDTKAICIPLVSSAGHGKKTLNYVHYQEGKFAIGSILAAVVPRNEEILDARSKKGKSRKTNPSRQSPMMRNRLIYLMDGCGVGWEILCRLKAENELLMVINC